MPYINKRLWRKLSGYAASHCTKCEAGFTRTSPSGDVIIVCLLDREPVPTDMANCDRYEAREANKA